MKNMTMCGYNCELCKAYAPNIEKLDQREMLSRVWSKYYDLDIKEEDIYCDGCRCAEESGTLLDSGCPVRKCVKQSAIVHCGACNNFPCSTFDERKGLSIEEAQEKLGVDFNLDEYNEYLLAYDNMTRLKAYLKSK